jgi:pimeloyl-ACP methyl ester carboxylesterase
VGRRGCRSGLRLLYRAATKRKMAKPMSPAFLDRGPHKLAYEKTDGNQPTLVWLGGFRSDMTGSKAMRVEEYAKERGQSCLRFDYAGHGQSTGAFANGTIGSWRDDAAAMIEAQASDETILVGSSMGGWIALLLAIDEAKRAKAEGRTSRIKALVLIAPAPDFTQKLMWPKFSDFERETIQREGQLIEPSPYDPEPTIITRDLIEDGKNHLILDGLIETACPVRILQGVADPDVPHTHALKLMDALAGEDVVMTLIKDGDHRLSRESDLAALVRVLDALPGQMRGPLI